MTLYMLADGIRAVLAAADARDGELTDADMEALDALVPALDQKAEAYAALIREAEAEAAARQAEVDRLRAGITAARNRADRLKSRLLDAMVATGRRKVEAGVFKLAVQASPPSAVCTVDPTSLPTEYKRVKVEADNAAALKCWRDLGVAPEGFAVTQGEHLRIR